MRFARTGSPRSIGTRGRNGGKNVPVGTKLCPLTSGGKREENKRICSDGYAFPNGPLLFAESIGPFAFLAGLAAPFDP